ncbi:MAG TPA: hypothetical protein ENI15_03250 [Spirochaetes bacterium]|nr:hypothetical protein [Spirochaetota bacterium]
MTPPAWINSKTAAELGIEEGDTLRVKSGIGDITIKANVTEGVHPKVIAISNHLGHWAYGEYASLKKTPLHISERDSELIWWKEKGVHPNWLIPNAGDPIGGTMRWMDTVVTVEKV